MNKFLPLFALAILSSACFAEEPKPVATVIIKGTGKPLGLTPIVVPIKAKLAPGTYLLQAKPFLPNSVTVFVDGDTTYLATVLEEVPAEGDVAAKLVPLKDFEALKLTAGKEQTAITLGGLPFTTYLPKSGPKPYLFPVIGPTGKPITRAFPMKDIAGEKRDHPHQRSFWFTHGNVNGIDFWSEQKGHGSIVETTFKAIDTPNLGQISTTDDWLGPDGKLVLKDERTLRFYSRSVDVRYIDFDITLKATNGPVTFGDTKEGMFGVRVATTMDVDSKKGGKITNSEGLTDAKAWGKPAAWVDYAGPVDGETVGIAILNHPSSFRHPTTWHVRTYGLFAANPFGWHDFGMGKKGDHTIAAGESLHFGYRVILHKGETASANLPAQYDAYVNPPKIEVKLD